MRRADFLKFVAPCWSDRLVDHAAIGRLLKRLHVRGLIMKVSRTRRWRVTDNGRRVLADTLQTYRRYHAQVD